MACCGGVMGCGDVVKGCGRLVFLWHALAWWGVD